jgi:hypothetical protein
MTYRPFEVPDDEEIFDRLGLQPTPVPGDEPTVRRLDAENADGRRLLLLYDRVGRSIRVQLIEPDGIVLDLFREGATRLLVASFSSRSVTIEFCTDELGGTLELDLGDPIRITDKLLLR